MWVVLSLFYGCCKSFRGVLKKQALKESDVLEILFFYSVIVLILSVPFAIGNFVLAPISLLYIFIKAAVIFIAWVCAFKSLKKIPLGIYGILDMTRTVFTILISVVVLHETLTVKQIIGIFIVFTGLTALSMLNAKSKETKKFAF